MNIENQAEITRMLGALDGCSDRPHIDVVFQPPFRAKGRKHDTGIQFDIEVVADDLPPLTVWKGSVWNSSKYEHNDHGKVLGFQPGCDWVRPALTELFQSISDRLAKIQDDQERAMQERVEKREREHAELIRLHAERFAAAV